MGPQTAEKLGIDQVTCVSEIQGIDEKNRTITVKRSIEGGYEILKAKLPVLLTFTDENYEARPASAIRMLAFKNATTQVSQEPFDESYLDVASGRRDAGIAQWDIETIKADPEACGLAGSPTKVKTIVSVVLKAKDVKMVENTPAGIAAMVHELVADHTIG